jgi:bifunctional DNA-binding transcriptional regulator/antitoxin component of YhaV-PrlF toxin-antitoxin module
MSSPSSHGHAAARPDRRPWHPSAPRPQTTAQGIIAALTLPGPSPPGPARPLPLPSLHLLPSDASMVYDIGSVDASGRIASHPVISAVGWQPGDRLDLIPATDAIVFRASPDGAWSVPPRGGVCLPARTRQRHRIAGGDRVLLAAAREYSVVIVYPASAINEMITSYHAARATKDRDHE